MNLGKKQFNQYRSEHVNKARATPRSKAGKSAPSRSEQSGLSGSTRKLVKCFSIQDIMEMSQSELNQAVFTLSDNHIELLDADNELTPLQRKLAKCK